MTADAKINKPFSSSTSPTKPRRGRGRPADLEVLDAESTHTGGKEITAQCGDNGDEAATRSKRKTPRRSNPASKQGEELAKLDKLFLRAWEETYESRKRRLG